MIKLPACLDQDCQLKIHEGSYIFVPNTILLLIVEVVPATAQKAPSKHTFPGNCQSAYQDSSRATIQIKQQAKSSSNPNQASNLSLATGASSSSSSRLSDIQQHAHKTPVWIKFSKSAIKSDFEMYEGGAINHWDCRACRSPPSISKGYQDSRSWMWLIICCLPSIIVAGAFSSPT